jgi:hypothetical protein
MIDMFNFNNKRSLRLLIATCLFALLTIPFKQAFAITQGELVGGGSIWLETTIAVALSFISVMAFSLQIARGYFMRTLNKFTLRLGADIWWLAYVMIRDGLLFGTFVMGLLVFFPGTFLDYDIAVPFAPVAVLLFGAALIIKLYFDADENRNAFRAVTGLTFFGTALWIFGIIFVTETPMILSPLPSSVGATSGIWYTIFQTFSSRNNLDLAMTTFQYTFPILGLFGLLGVAHPILHSRLPKLKQAISTKVSAAATTATPMTRIQSRDPAAKAGSETA